MRLTKEHHPGSTVVGLTGRLGMAEAPVLWEVVVKVVAGGARQVVLDLGGVKFMGSSGREALTGCRQMARRSNWGPADPRVDPRVQQVQLVQLVTSVHPVLPPYGSPEGAFSDD